MTATHLAASFERIGIFGRLDSQSVRESLARLIDILVNEGKDYAVEQSLADESLDCIERAKHRDQLGEWADLIIVIGGDGTFLSAARALARFETPMLGINRGRLGFLTDIMPSKMAAGVKAVLSGQFQIEDRFLLTAQVVRNGKLLNQDCAMNDVVLHAGQSIRMIEFDLYVDDQFVYSQKSDGLIISTPTGSTAYALSAGGPLVHPSIAALVIVPMFPHSLNNRPLVVGAHSRLSIFIGDQNSTPPRVSMDAQTHMELQLGDELRVFKYPNVVRLIHLNDHNYYETCRTKLGWSNPIQNDEKESE